MTYEEEVKNKKKSGEEVPGRLGISVVKYFWQRSPLFPNREGTIPHFLRGIDVLKNFTDNELRILSKILHERRFAPKEVIFGQDDAGFGFYLIYDGQIDIMVRRIETKEGLPSEDIIEAESLQAKDGKSTGNLILVASLSKGDYFGELALLQENSTRTATAVAKSESVLFGLFRPDVEELIEDYPVIGAKLLQSISLILANRHTAITREIQALKYKVYLLEKNGKKI